MVSLRDVKCHQHNILFLKKSMDIHTVSFKVTYNDIILSNLLMSLCTMNGIIITETDFVIKITEKTLFSLCKFDRFV